ncbi:MAG: RNase adapter RapZ [Clostridia bacterium]|nr:RNase adapter RapZ [Clostridia bacterium]
MELVIVTGMSGAGKTRAVNALEDCGYYCVDNMPPKLMTKFAQLVAQSKDQIEKIAIVTDLRGGDLFYSLFESLEELKSEGFNYKILFVDAKDEVIERRYKETRRKHPLLDLAEGSISKAIMLEREALRLAREKSDYVIDTSQMSSTQLRERMVKIFMGSNAAGMHIHCMSFGFKYGTPSEADLVFDVRCMPNPFYEDDLKNKTGLQKEVMDYVMGFPQAQGLLPRLYDLVDYLLPLYVKEGKSQLIVAIGCTGGRHRSVIFAEKIHEHLVSQDINCTLSIHHRDILK